MLISTPNRLERPSAAWRLWVDHPTKVSDHVKVGTCTRELRMCIAEQSRCSPIHLRARGCALGLNEHSGRATVMAHHNPLAASEAACSSGDAERLQTATPMSLPDLLEALRRAGLPRTATALANVMGD